jgi:plastocyanin
MRNRVYLAVACVLLASCNTSESCDCVAVEHDVRIVQGAATSGPNAFSPANFTISLATQDTVKWWNRDFSDNGSYGGNSGVTHRLVSDDGATFQSPNIPSNGTFVATFNAQGSYDYHCSIHPAMTGTVTVNP